MTDESPIIHATIVLRGDQLDPGHVSQVLGIQPSESQRKGGLRPWTTKYIAQIGMWLLQPQSFEVAVSDQIDELLKRLSDAPVPAGKIDGVEEAYLDLFISTGDEMEKAPVVELTHKQIEELSRLGVSVVVTVY